MSGIQSAIASIRVSPLYAAKLKADSSCSPRRRMLPRVLPLPAAKLTEHRDSSSAYEIPYGVSAEFPANLPTDFLAWDRNDWHRVTTRP
jgi:hypothetical protein